jgi:hypothetical protein
MLIAALRKATSAAPLHAVNVNRSVAKAFVPVVTCYVSQILYSSARALR